MKKIIKIIPATLIVLMVAFVLFPFIYGRIYGPFWESAERKKSLRILANTDVSQLTSECSLFLTFPDGSWMAIRYRDLHAGSGRSITMVRDSAGQWFESSHHFCAMFDGYHSQYKMYKLMREVGETEDFEISNWFENIHSVAASPSVASAREELVKMGFQPFKK